jgi:hypothetical protein
MYQDWLKKLERTALFRAKPPKREKRRREAANIVKVQNGAHSRT